MAWSELGKGSPGAERSRSPPASPAVAAEEFKHQRPTAGEKVHHSYQKTSYLQGFYKTSQLQAQNEQSRVLKMPKPSVVGVGCCPNQVGSVA